MNRNLKNLFNNQDTQTTVSSVSNNLSTFTSTPKVTNLHEFKRGAFVLSDQLNANFEALNSKLGEIVESYNSMSGLIATADVAKQIVLGGTLTPDLREDWPIVHLITITRPVIESDVLESSSQRQNLTASLNLANAGINMASSDSLDILVNVPANFTGNIFDKEAIANFEGGVATADVRSVIVGTDANLRFWYTYDYNTTTQEQTYKFYATPNYLYNAVYTDDEEKWGTQIEGIQPEDNYTIQTLKLNQITVYAGFFEAENLIFQFEGQLQAESSINTLLQTEWTTTGVDTIFSDETELIGIYAETWDLTGIIDDVNTFIEEATNVIEGFDEAKLNAFDGSNNLAPTFFDVVDTVIRPINFFNSGLFNNGNAVAAINSLNATNIAQTARLNGIDAEQDTQDNLIELNSSNILAISELIAAQTSGTFHGLNDGGTIEEGKWAVVKFTERQNTFKSIKYDATTGVFTLEEDFEILNVELLGQADNTGVAKDVTIRLMNHSDNTQVGTSQKETIGKFGKVIFNSTVDLPAGEYRLEITSSVGGGDISFTQGQISLIKYAGNINAAISSNIINDKALNPTAGINADLIKIDKKLDQVKSENGVTTSFVHNPNEGKVGMEVTGNGSIGTLSLETDGNVSTMTAINPAVGDFQTNIGTVDKAAVLQDGNLFIPSYDATKFMVVKPDGTEVSTGTLTTYIGSIHAATTLQDGNVFMPSGDGDEFIVVAPDGTEVYAGTLTTHIGGIHAATTLQDGNVFMAALDGKRFLVVQPDGTEVSTGYFSNDIGSIYAAVTLQNGNILIPSADGTKIIVVEPDGSQVQMRLITTDINSIQSATLLQDGNVFMPAYDGTSFLITSPDGYKRAEGTLPTDIGSTRGAVTLQNGNVFLLATDGTKFMITMPDGTTEKIPTPTEDKHLVNKKYVDGQLGAISTDTASITLTDPTTEGPTGTESTQQDVNRTVNDMYVKLNQIYNQIEID